MNPPSALQGAMGRERKPFTYTPGGLDLSEIKSERMAKRLMRNAMNQGVPEQPPHAVQSPPTPSTPIAVPNFNCLPVQVFPTFNLPANPKSLLRTRSNIDQPPRETPMKALAPLQAINNHKSTGIEHLRETINSNAASYPQVNNNNVGNSQPAPVLENNSNRPASMFEYSSPALAINAPKTSYGSDAYTAPVLPEISYDVEFFNAVPRKDCSHSFINPVLNNDVKTTPTMDSSTNFTIKPITENYVPIETKPVEDIEATDENDEQREVRVVKKQVKKEKKVETHNGDQNGDTETEMVVKLPSKTKVGPKVETKVEVTKKTRPDGSVEEIKTTTTRTTIDGRTEIKTQTETTIIPKEEEEEVEEVEEEEAEETSEVVVEETEENGETEVVKEPVSVVVKKTVKQEPVETSKVIKTEEKSETTTTKKVVVVQQEEEEEEEEEEIEEVEDELKPVKKTTEKVQQKNTSAVEEKEKVVEENKEIIDEKKEVKKDEVLEKNAKELVDNEEVEEEEEVEEVEITEKKELKVEETLKKESSKEVEEEEEEEVEEEEEYEEAEENSEKPEAKQEKPTETSTADEGKKQEEADDESEYTEEEYESEKEEAPKDTTKSEPPKTESEKVVEKVVEVKTEEPKEQPAPAPTPAPQVEQKIPLREPSVPLEKVEDIEIKPIGATHESVSKTTTTSTEITTSGNDKPAGTLSTQTEYNRYENIVTVNRTTKTLDHSYEQLTQQGIPTVKTYFAPDRERISTSPQPSRPYQSSQAYTPTQPQAQQERRHSLLLERLSTERQMPSDLYHNQNYQYNQNFEQQQRQWSQEPQSEVVNVSNVKPSSITNQQWFQQTKKENVIFNNVAPSAPAVSSQPQWIQPPPQPQAQNQYQPQQPLPQPQPQPQYQTSFSETSQNNSRVSSNTYQNYPSYTPTPANWASNSLSNSTLSNTNAQPNQYSLLNRDSTESYQKPTQQYSSSYVPPPWEQDPTYVAPPLNTKTIFQTETQNFYQPPPPANTFGPSSKPGWKPTPPPGKFSKPISSSYIPPAPNQSFVKTNVAPEPPILPGRKTYYSEYERRYITVPDTTYIPSETAKYQPQPDPSPQYYYDNNEPVEPVEPAWRKELREFTEKSSQQTVHHQHNNTQQVSHQATSYQQSEVSSVRPPWEEDPKYVKVPSAAYNPTPSWSQTLRPQSNRERSFESEFVGSNEWSKTNTLGRGRPLSSYGNSNVEASVPERGRGVSVDRYNPNNYQSPLPAEHGPVQAHTLTPTPPVKGHHNPNVPGHHSRVSAEPRDQTIPQARNWGGDSRLSPIQSRSFKYLQWITGTDN